MSNGEFGKYTVSDSIPFAKVTITAPGSHPQGPYTIYCTRDATNTIDTTNLKIYITGCPLHIDPLTDVSNPSFYNYLRTLHVKSDLTIVSVAPHDHADNERDNFECIEEGAHAPNGLTTNTLVTEVNLPVCEDITEFHVV